MARKAIDNEALAADIVAYGAAVRSLSPAEYEELEGAWEVREVTSQPPLQNGRRVCRITRRIAARRAN